MDFNSFGVFFLYCSIIGLCIADTGPILSVIAVQLHEDDLVQATIKKSLISKFIDKFIVKEAYNIRSLTVTSNTGSERATSHACRLQVEFSTRVTHLPKCSSIPFNIYRFARFDDIVSGKVPMTQYIDIVGKVYEIGPMQETKRAYKCRKIKLEDIEGVVLQCTLWAPHATELPEVLQVLPSPQQSKVVVLRGLETRLFDNTWIVQTTFNATTFELNAAIPEVEAFQESQSSQAPSNSLQIIEEGAEEESFNLPVDGVLSISQIVENEKAGSFYTVATIVDIDSSAGWYYRSCRSCRTKTAKNDKGRWVCKNTGCDGSKNGYMTCNSKFQLKFVVQDFTDTECNFVVFDNQVEQFLDTTAIELIAKMEKGGQGHSMPEELSIFLDQRYLFKIKIDDNFNVKQFSKSYTVSWMTDDVDKIHKWHTTYDQALKVEMDTYTSMTKDLRRKSTTSGSQSFEYISEISLNGYKDFDATSTEPVIDCETASTSSRITPLKRNGAAVELLSYDVDALAEDAASATKQILSIKKEKIA